jgi:glycolate oxidase FAD binding subunit
MSLQLMQRMGIHSAENRADRQTFESLTEAVEVQAWETLPAAQQASIAQAVAPDVTVSGVAYPSTPAALATLVQADDRQPLLPCGVGSKLAWGGLVGGLRDEGRGLKDEEKTLPLLVVSTERLKRLIDHAIGDLTVTVEAGMRFADVQATLATAGQYLPIDPAIQTTLRSAASLRQPIQVRYVNATTVCAICCWACRSSEPMGRLPKRAVVS